MRKWRSSQARKGLRKGFEDALSNQMHEQLDREARRKEEELHRQLEEKFRIFKEEQARLARQEEEERRQKRRDEDQKRAQHLREEMRGPRILSCCTQQDHLLTYFDEETLMVALGVNSYIAIWDRPNGYAFAGIPQDLADVLNRREAHEAPATLVALSPDNSNYYFIQFSDGSAKWCSPPDFHEVFEETALQPTVVTFGPADSWFMQFTDGSRRHSGLPSSLRNMLCSNKHRHVAVLSISLLAMYCDRYDAAWFIHWQDGVQPVWKLKNGSAKLNNSVHAVHEAGGCVRGIEFGSNDTWIVRYSTNLPADEEIMYV